MENNNGLTDLGEAYLQSLRDYNDHLKAHNQFLREDVDQRKLILKLTRKTLFITRVTLVLIIANMILSLLIFTK